MTTYGWSAPKVTGPSGLDAQPHATLTHEFHGLSAGYRCAIAGVIGPIPASDWIKRFARSPGVRKDAVAWYGLDAWLRTLGDGRVAGRDVLAKLEEREFSLRVHWSASAPDTLLVVFNPLEKAVADFVSVHHADVRNVLAHIAFYVDGHGRPVVSEVQSDWQQEGNISGWSKDPDAHRTTARAEREALDILVIDSVEAFHDRPECEVAVDHLLQIVDPGAVPDTKPVRLRQLWQAFRAMSESGIVVPGPDLLLPDDAAETVGSLLRAFQDRTKAYIAFRRDTPMPEAPFQSDWPRLALKVALAHAATAENDSGTPSFEELIIDEGDAVADRSSADEAVSYVHWNYDADDGIVTLLVSTEDVNGNSAARLPINCSLQTLAQSELGYMEGIGVMVAQRIEAGELTGSLDSEAIGQEFDFDSDAIVWKNMPLRRFYDNHLPRELREVARAAKCVPNGRFVSITEESRALLSALFPGVPTLVLETDEDEEAEWHPGFPI